MQHYHRSGPDLEQDEGEGDASGDAELRRRDAAVVRVVPRRDVANRAAHQPAQRGAAQKQRLQQQSSGRAM